MITSLSYILSNLVQEEGYMRAVYPFLKDEYFLDYEERLIFQLIKEYVDEYNKNPSKNNPYTR